MKRAKGGSSVGDGLSAITRSEGRPLNCRRCGKKSTYLYREPREEFYCFTLPHRIETPINSWRLCLSAGQRFYSENPLDSSVPNAAGRRTQPQTAPAFGT